MSDDKFEQTVIWAQQEENLRKTRGQGISSFYLFISSVMIISLLVFIIYLINKNGDDVSALEMMKDPENEYDDDFSNVETGSVEEYGEGEYYEDDIQE